MARCGVVHPQGWLNMPIRTALAHHIYCARKKQAWSAAGSGRVAYNASFIVAMRQSHSL